MLARDVPAAARSEGGFHPLIAGWFARHFGTPTRAQAEGWPRIAAGHDTLIAAPTGSGKTLAAFLWCIDALVKKGIQGTLEAETSVVYVSPLKALSNDVSRNLAFPLREVVEDARALGHAFPEITIAVRTGDTDKANRAKMARTAPHILVTTPESLYILLTSHRAREKLRRVRTVILDEIHAIAPDKRGAHLALSLERLDALVAGSGGHPSRPQRIGLSATQKPIEEIARLLTGEARPLPAIVDAGFRRDLDLAIELPSDELGPIASNEMMDEIYDRIAGLSEVHCTTLVFVNTRRMVERVAHQLAERIGVERVAAHHGSLSRATRLSAEERLKRGELRCVVATASLELGIDIGSVDLVVQIGSPRSIATFLQRIGRSGHKLGATPKGRLFAVTRDQLIECAALIRAVKKGQLDEIRVRNAPLDILAQQIVASAAAEEWDEDALFEMVRRAYPYRQLTRIAFDRVLEMLSEGIAIGKGRTQAYLHRDRIHRRIRARRNARLVAITSGGAIPDTADYSVIAGPEETFVGTVHEDFAIESLPGDIFLLGNTSWRIRRVESGRVRVENADGAPPTIPFWLGEAPSRTPELSNEVSELRAEIEERIERGEDDAAIASWLEAAAAVENEGAAQIVAYLRATRAALGALPTTHRIIAERFFDEAGGMQLVLHSPLGGRINRAFGLALRKRFCRTFNFELQAAATDDGLVLSLGPMHSFPLESVFDFLSPHTVAEVLKQAILQAPLFAVRWRWNAQRSLAVPRQMGGKRVPAPILRMRTDDLLASVFPMAQACQENLPRDIPIPDHPLVEETMRDCLEEALDLEGLRALLADIGEGRVRILARDTPEPSPLSHEILSANPYAFLDDAPLEERRARAVALRRGLSPDLRDGVGALDSGAIETVEREAAPEVRNRDELHDILLSLSMLPAPEAEARGWRSFMMELVDEGRATFLDHRSLHERHRSWVAAERVPLVRSALEGKVATFDPELPPLSFDLAPVEPEAARAAIVRGHLELSGPIRLAGFAARVGLEVSEVEQAVLALEAEGAVLRGRFRGTADLEWCDRRILARIHRLTLSKLRSEIEPVPQADFMRFLFRWQHVLPGTRLSGKRGLFEALRQLQGLEIAASAWERDVLRRRIERYDSSWLDELNLSGELVWGRLEPRNGGIGAILSRAMPLAIMLREDATWLLAPPGRAHTLHGRDSPPPAQTALGSTASEVLDHLSRCGASFFRDIVARTKRLPCEVEDALRELVYAGLVTADAFSSLRALLDRTLGDQARSGRPRARRGIAGGASMSPYASSLLRRHTPAAEVRGRWWLLREGIEIAPNLEAEARQLLARYGVVFRDLLRRETRAPAWRDLLSMFRRMEAKGEIRGGRFVGGFVGEQYALPEAVEALRSVRKRRPDGDGEVVRIAATDPLNMVGILSQGPRVPSIRGNSVLYRNGVPVLEAGDELRPPE